MSISTTTLDVHATATGETKSIAVATAQTTIPIQEKIMTTATVKINFRVHLNLTAEVLSIAVGAEDADKAARQARRAERWSHWQSNWAAQRERNTQRMQMHKRDGARSKSTPSEIARGERWVFVAPEKPTGRKVRPVSSGKQGGNRPQLVIGAAAPTSPVVTDGPSCPLGSRPVGAARTALVSGTGFSARVENGQVVSGRIRGRFASKQALEALPEVQEAIVATAQREAVRFTGLGFDGTTVKSSVQRRVRVGGRGRSMTQQTIRMAESSRARRETRDGRAAKRAAITAVSNAPRCALPVLVAVVVKAHTPAVGAMYDVQASPGRAAKPILRGYGIKPVQAVQPVAQVLTWDKAHRGMTEKDWAALAARALSAKTPVPTVGMAVTRRRA